jgi:hypothetical protein
MSFGEGYISTEKLYRMTQISCEFSISMIRADRIRADIIDRFRDRIGQGKRVKLYKEELEGLIEGFIALLEQTDSPADIQRLCQAEIALLEEGYERVTLASDYIPRYRKAIEAALEGGRLSDEARHEYVHHQRMTGIQERRQEHWALTFLKYSPEEYEALDKRQAQVNRKRLLSLKAVNPWLYVEKLDELLHSTGKFAARHRAIAIAGVTGRRIGEVLARGTFSLTHHPFMLHFEGQQKQERDGYDILTLIPAQSLLQEIEQFRAMAEIRELLSLEGKALTQAINKFDVQVNRECDRALMKTGIVPPLDGKEHVTVHNLRSLWGAIAVYLFCPPHHHEYAFLQHYLGHVLESSATGHYFRYQLVNGYGEPIQDKGIKLASIPELPLLDPTGEEEVSIPLLLDLQGGEDREEAGSTSSLQIDTPPILQLSATPAKRTRKTSMSNTKTRSTQKKKGDEGETQLSLPEVDALRTYVDTQLQELRSLLQQQSLAPSGFASDDLRRENQSLKDEITKLLRKSKQESAEIKKLRAENQALTAQLQEAQAKFDSVRQLLMGDVQEVSNLSLPDPSQETAIASPRPLESQPTPDKAPRGRKPGKAMERARHIYDAVREWNRLHPNETFVVNPGLLETIFKIHRQAAKQFCDEYQNELWEYQQEIGVQVEHSHNRGKNIQKLWEFVQHYA